ncbi:MAG: hypothetical protein FWH07_04480 [Oscillospiraceae bacterium]|nr:hypothetical protein [Oscillospiraceae bacterium]
MKTTNKTIKPIYVPYKGNELVYENLVRLYCQIYQNNEPTEVNKNSTTQLKGVVSP